MPTLPSPEEARLDAVILAMLDRERELYPSQMFAVLRRDHGDLPLLRTRAVLARLFAERRVARLWQRYLLPRDIEAVRADWLARIDRHSALLDAMEDDEASDDARDMVRRWTGWGVEGCDFAS